MHKNSSTPSSNIALWHYLGTKHLDYRHENNSTPGVLIKEIQQLYGKVGKGKFGGFSQFTFKKFLLRKVEIIRHRVVS